MIEKTDDRKDRWWKKTDDEKRQMIEKDNVMLENKSNYKELEQNLNRH